MNKVRADFFLLKNWLLGSSKEWHSYRLLPPICVNITRWENPNKKTWPIVSSKIYDKRDDFDFDIVNFPFLDGDVPRSTSYGVYISQLIRFARVSTHVVDFNARNKSLTAKLFQQGYRYHKLRKTFSKFYRRHYQLVSKFSVGLKTLLHQGLSEPEFYGDLVYKFKKIVGRLIFLISSKKNIGRYKRIAYYINIMRQSACLVFNPVTVNNFASLFNCTPVGRASDSMMAPT